MGHIPCFLIIDNLCYLYFIFTFGLFSKSLDRKDKTSDG